MALPPSTPQEAIANAHEWFERNSGWAPPDEGSRVSNTGTVGSDDASDMNLQKYNETGPPVIGRTAPSPSAAQKPMCR